jgi:hypothetical protein
MNAKTWDSCKELFIKDLKILPVHSQYTFPLSLFSVKNNDQYKPNQEIHSINTRYSMNLHLQISSLAVYTIMELRVFNHLPPNIKKAKAISESI